MSREPETQSNKRDTSTEREATPPPSAVYAEPSGHIRERHPGRAFGCVVFFFALLVVGGFAYHHWGAKIHKGKQAGLRGGSAGPAPVTVTKAVLRSVPIEVHVVGNAIPYQSVAVVSQVGGQLTHVFFKQGDFVRKGQPLFQIDPRPLQAALDQARANIARDEAQIAQAILTVSKDRELVRQARAGVHQSLANIRKDQAQQAFARSEDHRYGVLLRQGFVTAEQAEQQHANACQYDATVAADEAQLRSSRAQLMSVRASLRADAAQVNILRANREADEAAARNAQVQLGFTHIDSPLEGRTGSLNLYQGTIIKANDTTPMVTIDQITPIYVNFAVPEQYLNQIRYFQDLGALRVTAVMQDQEGRLRPDEGRVSFIDNNIDTATGTIAMRATFSNRKRHLWPGHYVNVTLKITTERNRIVVPIQAVQPGQSGDYVFIVDSKMRAQVRPVKVERNLGNEAVLASGVRPGETVVVDGQLLLVPGAKVTVESSSGAGAAGRTSGVSEARRSPRASRKRAAGSPSLLPATSSETPASPATSSASAASPGDAVETAASPPPSAASAAPPAASSGESAASPASAAPLASPVSSATSPAGAHSRAQR